MSKGIDNREISALGIDLQVHSREAAAEARKSMFVAGTNIKRRSREIIEQVRSEPSNIPAYPYSITFDHLDDGLTVDVGPELGRKQAELDNVLEYGSATQAPIPHLQPALEEEIPRAERFLSEIARGML